MWCCFSGSFVSQHFSILTFSGILQCEEVRSCLHLHPLRCRTWQASLSKAVTQIHLYSSFQNVVDMFFFCSCLPSCFLCFAFWEICTVSPQFRVSGQAPPSSEDVGINILFIPLILILVGFLEGALINNRFSLLV